MARRKLKRIEIVILVGFISSALTLIGFWWNNKEANRDFYLPKGYEGWIMINYGVAGADPLPEIEGVQQLRVPESGILNTSTTLEIGWRRDQFFWIDESGNQVPVPNMVELEEGMGIHIHQHQYLSRNFMKVGGLLGPGEDTTLYDGTEIEKMTSGYVNYRPGQKTLEYFYLSEDPLSITFNPPENPRSEALESVESREIKLEE